MHNIFHPNILRFRKLALVVLVVLTGGCAPTTSARCGEGGTEVVSGTSAYCSYVVVVSGFRCPAELPFRFEKPAPSGRSYVVCSNTMIPSEDAIPPQVCASVSGLCSPTDAAADVAVDGAVDGGFAQNRLEEFVGTWTSRSPGTVSSLRFAIADGGVAARDGTTVNRLTFTTQGEFVWRANSSYGSAPGIGQNCQITADFRGRVTFQNGEATLRPTSPAIHVQAWDCLDRTKNGEADEPYDVDSPLTFGVVRLEGDTMVWSQPGSTGEVTWRRCMPPPIAPDDYLCP